MRGGAVKQSLPVDTGSILGNYAINTWLSLSNVVAGYLSGGEWITNKVDDFFDRHLGYGAIQTVLPMSKTMGIAVEAGPAIKYAATWLSALSRNPRVVNAALAPIFLTTLPPDGAGTLPLVEFEHVGRTRSTGSGPWFDYQIRATGSRFEEFFRVWRNGVKQPDILPDALTNGFITEAKEGNLGYLGNQMRLGDAYRTGRTIEQVANYLEIAEAFSLRGVRYAVSTLEGAEVLELLFRKLHPEAVASGFLSVWWVP